MQNSDLHFGEEELCSARISRFPVSRHDSGVPTGCRLIRARLYSRARISRPRTSRIFVSRHGFSNFYNGDPAYPSAHQIMGRRFFSGVGNSRFMLLNLGVCFMHFSCYILLFSCFINFFDSFSLHGRFSALKGSEVFSRAVQSCSLIGSPNLFLFSPLRYSYRFFISLLSFWFLSSRSDRSWWIFDCCYFNQFWPSLWWLFFTSFRVHVVIMLLFSVLSDFLFPLSDVPFSI
jgi:hypothetical protein